MDGAAKLSGVGRVGNNPESREGGAPPHKMDGQARILAMLIVDIAFFQMAGTTNRPPGPIQRTADTPSISANRAGTSRPSPSTERRSNRGERITATHARL